MHLVLVLLISMISPLSWADEECRIVLGAEPGQIFVNPRYRTVDEFLAFYSPSRVPEFTYLGPAGELQPFARELLNVPEQKWSRVVERYVFHSQTEHALAHLMLSDRALVEKIAKIEQIWNFDQVVALHLFSSLLKELPQFFLLRPTPEQVAALLELPHQFSPGRIQEYPSGLYVLSFVRATTAIAAVYFENPTDYMRAVSYVPHPKHEFITLQKSYLNSSPQFTYKDVMAIIRIHEQAEARVGVPQPSTLSQWRQRLARLFRAR